MIRSAKSVLALTSSMFVLSTVGAALAQDDEIVVTAQRRSESLQDVPIAVSAFGEDQMQAQQIENPSDLQLTLPNITFTKTNFVSSSFTIRGVGDLCVGPSCDQATAIHIDGSPLFSTRLFETEFFDLERIEVLRGPQGTLFGRNATSGVVNFIPASPKMGEMGAAAEVEYGNYDSVKVKGMLNLPMGENLAARIGGFYLNREGYTENLFTGRNQDGRDMYALRGTLAWTPTDSTSVKFMAYYFNEDDDRMRIQKQQCLRDPSGVLGCLPSGLANEHVNINGTFTGTLASRQFLGIAGGATAAPLGITNLYLPDALASRVMPTDPRQVSSDFTPEYKAKEEQYQLRIEQDLGETMHVQLTGLHQRASVDSMSDPTLGVLDRATFVGGLTALNAAAGGPAGAFFAPVRNALFPTGPNGVLCTSLPDTTGVGAFGGNKACGDTPLDFDRSINEAVKSWSGEAILTTDFDGPFNFLLGGIYATSKTVENSYYVNSFMIDYISGVLGALQSAARAPLGVPPSYLGTPYFRNNTPEFELKSYGIFGEVTLDLSDAISITAGLRYNNDEKSLQARSTLANFLVPHGSTTAFSSPYVLGFARTGAPLNSRLNPYDTDQTSPCTIVSTTATGILTSANISGCDTTQFGSRKFDELTGRGVINFKVSDDSLLYFSASRGYKSGGLNPPVQPGLGVSPAFDSEIIWAYEAGSKNSFLDNRLSLNLTGFYYKYKGLQLSRIVNRTSINDNIDANIWGLELESIIRPTDGLTFNANASYLNTKVVDETLFANPRDPAAGRSDVVVVKDLQNANNCVVAPNTAGSGAGVNAMVNTINGAIGLQPTAAFAAGGGVNARGAFSICNILLAAAAGNIGAANPLLAALQPALNGIFGVGPGPLPVSVISTGVAQSIRGNELPQAPDFKWSVGAQYEMQLNDSGMTLTPRFDAIYVGDSFGNIFNGAVNKVPSYYQFNAQMTLSGADDRWHARAFIQNIADNNAVTGLHLTDQTQGVVTNIFTLEPRRYGVAFGLSF